MTSVSTSRAIVTAMATGVLVLSFAHLAYYGPRTVDDMFIYLRYAENFASGHGPVHNLGERVEGYSSPVWLALLTLGELLGIGGLSFAKALGIVSFLALQLGTYCFVRTALRGSVVAALGACLFLALNSYVVSWTSWGLETPAYMALLVWTAFHFEQLARVKTRRAAFHLGIVGAVFALSRPEAPLFVLAFGVAYLATSESLVEVRRRTVAVVPAAGIVIAIFGVHLAVRYGYFGLPLPHTYYAKQGQGYRLAQLAPLFGQGASIPEIVAVGAALGCALILAIRRVTAIPLATVAAVIVFVPSVTLDWMPNVRHFLPLWLFAPMALVVVADRSAIRGSAIGRAAGITLSVIALTAAVAIARVDARFSPFDFRTHGRGVDWVRSKTASAVRDTWLCFRRVMPPHVEAMGTFEHGMITQLYRVLEADGRPLEETWYIGRDIGAVGWLSPVNVFETDGLFTPALVRSESWVRERAVDQALVEEGFRRDVIATELFDGWAEAARRNPWVRSHYEPSHGNWSYLRPRNATAPSEEQVLARYEHALSKMPRAYFAMTLYGEAVGAALTRRVDFVRQSISDHRNRWAESPQSDLVGGPVALDDAITLLGCSFEKPQVRRGEAAVLSCWFRTERPASRDYSVFVHFEGPNGARISADHRPAGGFEPSRQWRIGSVLRDVVRIPIPAATSTGEWVAYVGLYEGAHRARIGDPALGDDVGRVIGPRLSIRE